MIVLIVCLQFIVSVDFTNSVAIDNGVVGEPSIVCMENGIHFEIKAQKPFAGRIYAKGKVNDKECVKTDYVQQKSTNASVDLQFGTCGMKGVRTNEPQGMFYGVTLVVSFHPMFLTKVDKAYFVKCFFAEIKIAVTANVGVSMIATSEAVASREGGACVYSIHKGTFSQLDEGQGLGPPLQFAQVGDKILHRWDCPDPMFGIFLHDCTVSDGSNETALVIDSKGCPVDPILISGIRYATNLTQAFAESHVFKFADKPAVLFSCQIQQCMIMSGSCTGLTPPPCAFMGTGSPVIGGSSTKLVSSVTTQSSAHSRRTTTGGERGSTAIVTGSTPPAGYGPTPRPQATLIYQADDVFSDEDTPKKTKAGDLFDKISREKETFFWSIKHNDSAPSAKEVTDDQELSEKLIIFDLDEHPPNYYQTNRNAMTQGEDYSPSTTAEFIQFSQKKLESSECVVSSQGLIMILVAFGSISGLLLLILLIVCLKFRRSFSQCQQRTLHREFERNRLRPR